MTQNMPAEADLHAEKGFTLIEAVLSLAVLTVASLGTIHAFTYATSYNSSASQRALAVVVAQQRAESLRGLAFGDTSLLATSASGRSESVVVEGHSFDIVTTIVDSTPTLKTITLSVTPSGDGRLNRRPATVVLQRSSPLTGPNL